MNAEELVALAKMEWWKGGSTDTQLQAIERVALACYKAGHLAGLREAQSQCGASDCASVVERMVEKHSV